MCKFRKFACLRKAGNSAQSAKQVLVEQATARIGEQAALQRCQSR